MCGWVLILSMQCVCRWDMFQLFYWLKLYPTWRAMSAIFDVPTTTIQARTWRRLLHLSEAMSHIIPSLWDQRYEVENPCRDFIDGNVVGSVDTVPIRIYYPEDRDYARASFQPKYAGPVVKIQVVVGHSGLPIFISGPHPGLRFDFHIWGDVG